MIYNGRDFSEFGVHVDESKAFGSPEKDYELIEVVGRNGNLSINNDRFKDIVLSFPCFIRSGFIEKYRNLLAYLNSLNGYQRLETEKEPNHFRKALFTGSVEVQTTPWNQGGFFTINFSALPQRFLKSGETTASVSSSSSSVTGNPVSISNPSGLTSLTGLSVDIEPVQSGEGDPSPTNIRPITGHTSASVTRTGKNLLPNLLYQQNASTVILGQSDASFGLYLKKGTYTVSAKSSKAWAYYYRAENGTSNIHIGGYNTTQATFTLEEDTNLRLYAYLSAGISVSDISEMQLEYGTEATAYEPYTGQTVTVGLNGTVYGGTLDVSTGVLTVTHVVGDLGTYNWSKITASGNDRFFTLNLQSMVEKPATNATVANVVCSAFVKASANDGFIGVVRNSITVDTVGTVSCYPPNGQYADGESFKTAMNGIQFVYPLATPTTVQLTAQQVSLLTGTNIISTDMESVTVTLSNPAELENPTLFESKPLIRVYGNGTLNVNDIYITVANSPYTYIDIDCELMDCYYGSNNANQYVSFSTTDYVTLRSGTNYFSYSGFTQVEVTPRWFEV